jgi:hypothetical protein
MPKHIIEYKQIGKKSDNLFIIVIDGREIGEKMYMQVAVVVADWLMKSINDLEKLL